MTERPDGDPPERACAARQLLDPDLERRIAALESGSDSIPTSPSIMGVGDLLEDAEDEEWTHAETSAEQRRTHPAQARANDSSMAAWVINRQAHDRWCVREFLGGLDPIWRAWRYQPNTRDDAIELWRSLQATRNAVRADVDSARRTAAASEASLPTVRPTQTRAPPLL